jgi:hypothetical protein
MQPPCFIILKQPPLHICSACAVLCCAVLCRALQFVEELSKLQDRVPAFSADKAAAIVEADLGQPVSKLFRSFDARPIAAASLGQVSSEPRVAAIQWQGTLGVAACVKGICECQALTC